MQPVSRPRFNGGDLPTVDQQLYALFIMGRRVGEVDLPDPSSLARQRDYLPLRTLTQPGAETGFDRRAIIKRYHHVADLDGTVLCFNLQLS